MVVTQIHAVVEHSQRAARDCIRLPGNQVVCGGVVEVGEPRPSFGDKEDSIGAAGQPVFQQ